MTGFNAFGSLKELKANWNETGDNQEKQLSVEEAVAMRAEGCENAYVVAFKA